MVEIPLKHALLDPENVLFDLIDDLLEEPVWGKLLGGCVRAPQHEEDETIYGIRTNINAVNEYCNLLIKFVETNHVDQLVRKITLMKLEKAPPQDGSSVYDRFQVWKARVPQVYFFNSMIYLDLEN